MLFREKFQCSSFSKERRREKGMASRETTKREKQLTLSCRARTPVWLKFHLKYSSDARIKNEHSRFHDITPYAFNKIEQQQLHFHRVHMREFVQKYSKCGTHFNSERWPYDSFHDRYFCIRIENDTS